MRQKRAGQIAPPQGLSSTKQICPLCLMLPGAHWPYIRSHWHGVGCSYNLWGRTSVGTQVPRNTWIFIMRHLEFPIPSQQEAPLPSIVDAETEGEQHWSHARVIYESCPLNARSR